MTSRTSTSWRTSRSRTLFALPPLEEADLEHPLGPHREGEPNGAADVAVAAVDVDGDIGVLDHDVEDEHVLENL